MAWVKETSATISVDDWGAAGTDYANCYAKATLSLSTDKDTVNWKITMSTKVGTTTKKPAVALYLKINNKVLYNNYYNYKTPDANWLGFPTKNGSTDSGSVTVKNDSSSSSIPVTLKIATSDNAVIDSRYWKTKTTTLKRTWYTPIGTGDVKIKDNGNNTFTITGTKGKDGDNNTASGPNLSWGYTDSYGTTTTSGKAIGLTIEKPTAATRRVYAKNVTKAAHGSSTTAKTYADIKQHVAPNAPTNLEITHSKSRMTIKENWTLSWTAATAKNKSSPITGYRIRLFKNGKAIPLKNSNGKIVSTAGTDDNYYDRPLTTTKETTMLIDMQHYDFKPGDKVKATLYAYHTNGAGTKLFSSRATSDTYTVQNSGIMRAKLSGAWKEGQVYVKISGDWKEAAAVYVKINGSWKEST